MKQKVAKKQHYIPKMHLKRFTFNGTQGFSLNQKGEIHCQHINSICRSRTAYETINTEGNIIDKNSYENILSKVERYYDIEIARLIESIDRREDIADPEKTAQIFYAYVAFMFLRHPTNMKTQEQKTRYWEEIVRWGMNKETCKRLFLDEISQLRNKFDIVVYKNISNTPFITSSSLYCVNHGEIYFPLSNEYSILLTTKRETSPAIKLIISATQSTEQNCIFRQMNKDILFGSQTEAFQ